MGGLLVYDGHLYGTAYAYYVGADDAKRSHYKTSLDLSDGAVDTNFKGMFALGDLNPGFTGGYMFPIPEAKRALFGNAEAFTGQSGLAIITRSSLGPSLHTFSPADLDGVESKIDSTPLVYYPNAHPNLGEWGNAEESNPSYNQTTKVEGVVYPDDSEFVYFIGRTGVGIPAYGQGSTNPDDEIYDPVDTSKGCHAWPYANYLWIYHEDDLQSVYYGEKEPWDIYPVSEGVVELPFYNINKDCSLSGITYDAINQILYISAKHRNGTKPVIHCYEYRSSSN